MKLTKRHIVILLFSIIVVLAEVLILVRQKTTVYMPPPDIEKIISIHPDHWHPIKSAVDSVAWKKSAIGEYDKIAERTYQNDYGQQVTVAMTWSRDGIRRAGHIQQLCYTAQGSIIKASTDIYIQLNTKQLKTTRFDAYLPGGWIEDVVYWRLTGGQLEQNRTGFEQIDARLSHRMLKIQRMIRLLYGVIPDNVMVRMSYLRNQDEKKSNIAIEYLKQYLLMLTPADRKVLTGL
jgi:hypothetical protein